MKKIISALLTIHFITGLAGPHAYEEDGESRDAFSINSIENVVDDEQKNFVKTDSHAVFDALEYEYEYEYEQPFLLSAGPSSAYLHFKPQNGPSFTGNLSGAQIFFAYRPIDYLYQAVRCKWQQGTARGAAGKRSIVNFDAQERLGYTMQMREYTLTAFTGFGWRYVSHELSQEGLSPLDFYYNEVYIPLGLLVDCSIRDAWSCGFHLTWMPQVFPTVDIEPIGGTRWILKKSLSNVLIELPLRYSGCGQWSFAVKPFFEYWQEGKTVASTGELTLGLPQNTYKILGAELNIGYAF